MAEKPVPSKDDLKLESEDMPLLVAERYLNGVVLLVGRLERELRQAKADERRARAELAGLDEARRRLERP